MVLSAFNTMGEPYHTEKKQDKKKPLNKQTCLSEGIEYHPPYIIWYLCAHAGHGNVVIDKTVYFRAFREI